MRSAYNSVLLLVSGLILTTATYSSLSAVPSDGAGRYMDFMRVHQHYYYPFLNGR